MFIVKKKIKENKYYYLRQSKRIDGKVKAINIAYLGKNKKQAEEKAREFIRKMENKGKREEEKEEKEEGKEEKEEKEKKEKAETKKPAKLNIDEITTFCKRKGFVYLSGEIYGGFAGFWDYGALGVELKNNLKKEWWKFYVHERKDIIGIDGSIITHPKTWQASGHTESFNDISVICKKCKRYNKVDKFELDKAVCSFCKGELNKKTAKHLNMMFSVNVGPIKEDSSIAYLRPETAQLIFTNFKQVAENSRMKLPFGIAQIGKAFRNEIAPRDFLFRAREFEQMEIEYFIFPNEKCPYKIPDIKTLIYSAKDQKKNKEPEEMKIKHALNRKIIKKDWHAYWLALCLLWFRNLGCDIKNFRLRQHQKDELAHYSTDCWDIEYRFPFGWKELIGIADRGNYDLSRHEKFSGRDLRLFIEGKGKILPEVIAEPSFGVDRAFLAFMFEAYQYDKKRKNIVLRLHSKLAPIKAAVFPIVNKPDFLKLAEEIYKDLRSEFNIAFDTGGSIGKRYARQDEIGTIIGITIDGQSLKDNTVTLRDRDTTEQVRVKIKDLKDIIRKVVSGRDLLKFGRSVETRVK